MFKKHDGWEDRRDKVKSLINKKNLIYLPVAFIVILVLAAVWSGAYTVKQGFRGVETRFEKYNITTSPGLKFKIPFVDDVFLVNVEKIYQEPFGFQASREKGDSSPTVISEEGGTDDVSLMLTGDLNVVVVPWVVQYKIADPKAYLFNIENPIEMLRDNAEAVMRAIVGDRSIDEVLKEREAVANEAKPLLQIILDEANTGLSVVAIEMKKTDVPGPVQESFNAVNKADQRKQQRIFEAKKEYNDVVPKAKGQAQAIIREAEGEAIAEINRATGETAEFSFVYEKYKGAKDITKKRLYYEAVLALINNSGGLSIVDDDLNGILPMLNLNKKNNN
ncbi:FtsH protease activity modulator HflK [Candidatus Pacearchaeota archaeon]|nr:FtsH protease activity modulator HflK [Candidatus Pacearchaeota archaeon]